LKEKSLVRKKLERNFSFQRDKLLFQIQLVLLEFSLASKQA